MTDRTVKAILKADASQFVAGMKSAQKATADFSKDATASATKHGEAWTKVGTGMMATGAVIGAGVALAVKSFMDFDAAMSQAQAGTMATGAALDALRAAAIDAGAKTQYSAVEAADAITAMGKAGVSTKDILGGGLVGALSLAAAGQLDVATAAEIAATAMNQFGLAGSDIPHIADLLAAGAGKAMGSVQDLAAALKYVGPTAKGLGISIEQTTGALAMFAQQGLLGEQAGTSLRGVLLTLTSPSAVVAKRMEELGINVYDAGGKFIGLDGAAGQLQAKLGPLDDATRNAALGQIFGNEQVGAARILYEGGAGAVQKWTANVNDAGFAARQAAMLTDNLKGDIERLGGSLSSVLIQSGSGANGMLRTMTQTLQGLVDLYGGLPVPVQQAATALGGIATAALLAGGGLIVLAPRIVETKAALANIGKTGELLSGGLSKAGTAARMLGGPLVLATVALGYFAKQAQESKARIDELAGSLEQQTGAITAATSAVISKTMADNGSLAAARSMGIAAGDLTLAYQGQPAALIRVNEALRLYEQAGAAAGDQTSVNADEANKLRSALGLGNEELTQAQINTRMLAEEQAAGGAAADGAATKTDELAAAQAALKTETQAAVDAIREEVQALQDAGLVVLTTAAAQRALLDAQDAANASLKKNGEGLDINNVKQRENRAALDGQATAALHLADAVFKETGSEEKMRASLIASRDSLVQTAIKFGMTKAEAVAYADSIIKIPASKLTKADLDKAAADAKIAALKANIDAIRQGKVPGLDANSAAAKAKIAELQRQIDALNGKTVYINTIMTTVNRVAGDIQGGGGLTKNSAAGGYITGSGTTTSDSIHAMLSNKEYVIRADAVAKYGVGTLDAINTMRFSAGGSVPSGSTGSDGSSMVDMSGVRRDLAQQTAILRTLIPGFAGALDQQARTLQTAQRQR